MLTVLGSGPRNGVYGICLDDARELLPEECRAVISYDDSQGGASVEVYGNETLHDVIIDEVAVDIAETAARALAPIRRIGSEEASTVPESVRFLHAADVDPPTPERIREIWQASTGEPEALLGATEQGNLYFNLVRDGPHGLVAGTTGAGKSELLQTLIAGLALSAPPSALNFVLIDYKGGTAFHDCARLPHTVGLVTDLDGHLTERALSSLRAELKRRERLLSSIGAKDLDDYASARLKDPDRLVVIPRLVIVIDEFASLIDELPDFVKGLVGIAQLGRALGVHLILATQRPSGVVSPEIRANANFAIALRVVNSSESSDIIGSGAAATISPSHPGRAFLRVAQQPPVCFQTARVGGRRLGVAEGRNPVVVNLKPWSELGLPDPPAPRPAHVEDDATDLHVLMMAIRAATIEDDAQRKPWLEPLPDQVLIANLPAPASSRAIPFGLEDLPVNQAQVSACVDLTSGRHVLWAGSPRSGRSSALRAVAGSMARTFAPNDAHLYAVDCGGGGLASLSELPHTGAVIPHHDSDRVERLFRRLVDEVQTRSRTIREPSSDPPTSATGVESTHVTGDRSHLILMIDNWEGFYDTYHEFKDGALEQQLISLLRSGGAVGLTIVLSGDRSLLATSRISSLVEDKFVLRFNTRDDYTLVGLSPRKLPATVTPGRCFRAISGEEIQVALLTEGNSVKSQRDALGQLGQAWPALSPGAEPFRVDALPPHVELREALTMGKAPTTPMACLAGVGGDTLTGSWLDLSEVGPALVVVGPPGSGRSSALRSITKTLTLQGCSVVVIAPRKSVLLDLRGETGVIQVFEGKDGHAPDLGAWRDFEGPLVVVIDDAEQVEPDHPVLNELATARREDRGVLLAGNLDDIRDAFRGFTAASKRSGTGILLSPKSHLDAAVFNGSLPRGSGFSGPAGRGYLFVRGRLAGQIQVPVSS